MSRVKYKYIIACFIIGFVINLFGALQKILHSPNANSYLTIAFYIMAGSTVIATAKILFQKRKDSFLDK